MRSISAFWLTSEMCSAANVPLDRPKPQDHLPHVVRQAVDARTDVAQMLEDEVGRLFSHGSLSDSTR